MSKKVIDSYDVVVDQSLGASFFSDPTNTLYMDRLSYSGAWTGSAVGTLIAQGSADGENYADLDMNDIVLNNADDVFTIDIQCTGLLYVRLSYTRSSGTGTINAAITAKES